MDQYVYSNDYEKEQTQKYEGVYTPEEIELNRKLYAECSKDVIDFELVEELLKRGADPLGGTSEYGWGLLDHVYGELVLYSQDSNSVNLPKITELFLKYGMDVSSPKVPYDQDNSIHVLRYLPENENAIIALKMLLDNGVDPDSVCEFWDRFIYDEINVHCEDPYDEEWHDYFVWAMKMIMLIASYDHVLNNDEDLQKLIGFSYNTYDVHNFRNWNNYRYEFDTSHCERHPELYKSIIKIYEEKTNREIWRFGIHLEQSEF